MRFILNIALTFAAVRTVQAASVPIDQCPSEMPESAVHVQPAKPGWKASVRTPLRLTSAQAMVGPPDGDSRGELIGNRRTIRKDVTETSYALPSLTIGGDLQEKWMVCGYGSGDINWSYRLPDQVKLCVVRYTRNQYRADDITIKCE